VITRSATRSKIRRGRRRRLRQGGEKSVGKQRAKAAGRRQKNRRLANTGTHPGLNEASIPKGNKREGVEKSSKGGR